MSSCSTMPTNYKAVNNKIIMICDLTLASYSLQCVYAKASTSHCEWLLGDTEFLAIILQHSNTGFFICCFYLETHVSTFRRGVGLLNPCGVDRAFKSLVNSVWREMECFTITFVGQAKAGGGREWFTVSVHLCNGSHFTQKHVWKHNFTLQVYFYCLCELVAIFSNFSYPYHFSCTFSLFLFTMWCSGDSVWTAYGQHSGGGS